MTKLLNMIGLAKRAGKISTGSFICEKMIKSRTAKLVVLAADASENTKKTICDSCKFYDVYVIEAATMDTLGHAVGADALRAVISVNDNNFAKAILDIYLNDSKKG